MGKPLTFFADCIIIVDVKTGDRFAADWENEAPLHCDVLKLPHHGDEKSMTAPLLNSMMPHYMVIS
ncbi:MAG: hypothetical protein II782_03090, partial [Oscillospiraceae bacterium]|nr:hypothetical protein [Oscillospiraceae bacterium]